MTTLSKLEEQYYTEYEAFNGTEDNHYLREDDMTELYLDEHYLQTVTDEELVELIEDYGTANGILTDELEERCLRHGIEYDRKHPIVEQAHAYLSITE